MSVSQLPAGYKESGQLDLKKDKKLAIILNVGVFIIVVAMVGPGLHIRLYNISIFLQCCGEILVGIVVFIVSYELVRRSVVKYYGGKPTYSFARQYFARQYVCCGCETSYFNKKEYFVIAWIPAIMLSVALIILAIVIPHLLLTLYLLLTFNLSCVIINLYISYYMHKQPDDVLAIDVGTTMKCYSKG